MSALVLCLSHLSTKLVGLDRTVAFFRWVGQMSKPRRTASQSAEELAERAVRGMQFLPLRVECLDQAIATWFALNRNGHPAFLRIGMRLAPLSGHAWVTCDEHTFIKVPGLEDFTVVASYSPWPGSDSTILA